MIRLPSRGTVSLWAGRVPQAMRTFSARACDVPSTDAISSVCGSRNRAWPGSVTTWFRLSCDRMTSISRARTFCTRKARSATVMSLETV